LSPYASRWSTVTTSKPQQTSISIVIVKYPHLVHMRDLKLNEVISNLAVTYIGS
jgi:hypothetical protein